MPRFFFHFHGPDQVYADATGSLHRGRREAMQEAVDLASDLVTDEELSAAAKRACEIRVADEAGAVLAVVPVANFMAQD